MLRGRDGVALVVLLILTVARFGTHMKRITLATPVSRIGLAIVSATLLGVAVMLVHPTTQADGTCATHHPYKVIDGHGHDRDGNGIGCESNPLTPAAPTTQQRLTAYDRSDWAFDSGAARGLLSCSPYEHVDHIVALKEAHDAGAADWTQERKREFANDPLNLWCLNADLNIAKSDHDLAEWGGGSCIQRKFIAERTALIKTAYELLTDDAEAAANAAALEADCTFTLDADRLSLIRLLLRTLLELLSAE